MPSGGSVIHFMSFPVIVGTMYINIVILALMCSLLSFLFKE